MYPTVWWDDGTGTGTTKTQVRRIMFAFLRSDGRNILSPTITDWPTITATVGFITCFSPVPTTNYYYYYYHYYLHRFRFQDVSATSRPPSRDNTSLPLFARAEKKTLRTIAANRPARVKAVHSRSRRRKKPIRPMPFNYSSATRVPGNRQGSPDEHIGNHSARCFSNTPVNRIYVPSCKSIVFSGSRQSFERPARKILRREFARAIYFISRAFCKLSNTT